MNYHELKSLFREHEASNPPTHLSAHIVFTEDSFSEIYSKESRTYVVSSFNKAFLPNMGGYSIFGSCVDGTDPNIRLEGYMASEHGGENGWKVEECYLAPECDNDTF